MELDHKQLLSELGQLQKYSRPKRNIEGHGVSSVFLVDAAH